MNEIKIFILKSCPHCIRAFDIISELCEKNPEYKRIQFEIIDEQEQADLANSYDYYYVPSIFVGGQKLLEGVPTPDGVKKALDAALSAG